MKSYLIILTSICFLSFAPTPECGDGAIYASTKQTQYDKRFDSYTKINSSPSFKGGDKKLDKLIRSQLKLSSVAKTQIFNLNYQFTVTCDGKITDIKQLGDPKGNDWTNIVEIIASTEGSWKPAVKGGKTVNCVYFRTLFINGSSY
jgi:hypothetical protein